jgi:allophanate hydrolase
VPFAIGTDTAGSGRVPAALNGIVGLKPTVGRYDIAGIVPAVRRFDCPSVFARSVTDATAVAAAMAPLPPPRPAPRWSTEPVIGLPDPWPASVAVEPDIAASFRSAVAQLAARGPTRAVDVEPLLALGRLLYGSALVAERAVTAGPAIRRGVAGLDPIVAAVIGGGARYSAEDAYRAEYELADLRAAARRALAGVDVLALPTTPQAPTLADVAADPIGTNTRLGTFTTFANLLDVPVVVVPLPGPVPAGLQLIGAPWCDDELGAFAGVR